MIHGTLVRINRDVIDKPDVAEFDAIARGAFTNQVMDTGWELSALKTIPFRGKASAFASFQRYLESDRISPSRHQYGMLIHVEKSCLGYKEICLAYEEEKGCLIQKSIANPLWRGVKGVRRHLGRIAFDSEVSMAMQSQLFAMLDSVGGDSKWMQSFQLKDRQQQDMYRWQDEVFENRNDMSPSEMMALMKNVLSVARLPWIPLHFKESGNACMFAITRDNGKTLTVEGDGGDQDETIWGWLGRAGEDQFERVGVINDGYRLRISDMRLEMVMSWAMNAKILLHEIAHYINFVHPTPYRVNNGEFTLNYDQYEEIFAGHGAAYMAVFSRLLIDFHYINEEALYDNLNSSGLAWFPIKSIRVEDLTEGITSYCQRYQ